MKEINAEWLRRKLGDDRGLKAELARETGIDPDKISKILSGTRKVQASEAPKIYRHFNPIEQPETAIEPLSPDQIEMLDLLSRATDEERMFLLKTARANVGGDPPED